MDDPQRKAQLKKTFDTGIPLHVPALFASGRMA